MICDIIEKLKTPGAVVAIRTDTVYGLICNAFDKLAVKKIYDIKKRDKRKPLSLFVKDIDEVKKYVSDENLTIENISLMKKYWPGAITMIFKKKDDTLNHLTNGMMGIGIRIPNDKDLLDIMKGVDFPLAETSCNISNEEPYIDYESIKNKFEGIVDMIVDGGKVENNVPSTVISLEANEMILIRQGEIKVI